MLQCGERGLSAAFLKVGQRGIENQKPCDHFRFKVLVEYNLENNGEFKQPRNRRPELDQHISQRVSGCVRHRIRTVLL
jgi:hypothetical protein